jgi:hypothetical protein
MDVRERANAPDGRLSPTRHADVTSGEMLRLSCGRGLSGKEAHLHPTVRLQNLRERPGIHVYTFHIQTSGPPPKNHSTRIHTYYIVIYNYYFIL